MGDLSGERKGAHQIVKKGKPSVHRLGINSRDELLKFYHHFLFALVLNLENITFILYLVQFFSSPFKPVSQLTKVSGKYMLPFDLSLNIFFSHNFLT